MSEPIRILHIVTYMGRGGLETMLMNYYRNIDRNIIQFDFLSHRKFEAEYDREIQKLGGRIYHISKLIPWSSNYKNELKSFFIKHPEYRIVHVHQDCLSSVALKCAQECGIPVRIAHSHTSSAAKNIKYPIKLYYMRQIPKYATHLFACGEKAGSWMFRGNEYRVIRNAIDISKFKYNPQLKKEVCRELGFENKTVIGHVGNFGVAKNHSFLIDIFKAVHDRDNSYRLLLVGDGKNRNEISEKVKRLGLMDCVVFLGTRNDVNRIMQAMDVFVFPSLFEGLPVTMIEEQAAGIPAVISDNVSKECIITENLVEKISLDKDISEWVTAVFNQASKGKSDQSEAIQAAGYDIKTEARNLQNIYLSLR